MQNRGFLYQHLALYSHTTELISRELPRRKYAFERSILAQKLRIVLHRNFRSAKLPLLCQSYCQPTGDGHLQHREYHADSNFGDFN